MHSNANQNIIDNATNSTGLSAGSGVSTGINGGFPQAKQKQRYMMSPVKTKKSDPEIGSGSNYKLSRPQMLNLGASSDYQDKSIIYSPEKAKNQSSPDKFKIKDKVAIPSFL